MHLVGTITYYDPANQAMFLQDSTGAVFINTDRLYPVREGDLVAVDGKSEPSYRSDVALDPSIHVLGRGKALPAPLYTFSDLIASRADCQLVTIRGRVRAADVGEHVNAPVVHLDVAMPSGEVEIYIPSTEGFHPEALLDADIEVTGVAGGSFDAKWQITGAILYVQNASAIRMLHKPPHSLAELPLTDIDSVFPSLDVRDASKRMRVQGTVTYYKKGAAVVLERDGKSIYVHTRQTTGLAIGDVADAFGFASNSGYAPELREALIVKTGRREPIAPRRVSYAEALYGTYSDNLVAISGKLVSELHDVGYDTLVLDVDGHLVSAYLEGSAPLAKFPIGSGMRVAGICRILPGNPWQAPYVFHLEMRNEADAQLTARPSWWTIVHLVELVSTLAVLALVTAIWAMILRARVLGQTQRIKRSMFLAEQRSRILGKISANQSSRDAILSEICESVKTLLPGTVCTYSFSPWPEVPEGQMEQEWSEVFTIPLAGPEEEVLGKLVASTRNKQPPAPDQQEIYSTVRELAMLAMRQSLLYEKLIHHSTHDALTELPNRRLCDMRMGEALQTAVRQGTCLLVIYIDVDHFKQVNDQHGHKVGDLYLQQISVRLLAQTRPTDTLARIGGDEFLVIVPFEKDLEQNDSLVARLRGCFDAVFCLDGVSLQGSASFGVASYPKHGSTAEELKRYADQAMYMAKQSEARKTDTSVEIAVITPHELELALRNDLFRLVYQPQFSAEGRLTGLEALLRLEDPILGTLTPDAFISIAERYEVIHEIGEWVLHQAIQDALAWHLDTGEDVVLAVNVSVSQLRHPGFAASVLAGLETRGFPAERLELELIERSLMSSNHEVTRQLEQLRCAGVRISLDDFGTGQSCLSMLHKLPVDTIKLDRSFIVAMDDEPAVIPIIRAISSMAHSLGKRVVAEGIEHVGPVPTLLEMGEMDFQGYLMSRPLGATQMGEVISGWRLGIEMPEEFRRFEPMYEHRKS